MKAHSRYKLDFHCFSKLISLIIKSNKTNRHKHMQTHTNTYTQAHININNNKNYYYYYYYYYYYSSLFLAQVQKVRPFSRSLAEPNY